VSQVASWQRDVLGPDYEMMTLALGTDYEGAVIAALVRRRADRNGRRAALYVHGYNDYFFQKHVADFSTGLGITAWKSVSGTRPRMAWLASVHAGQRRVREGPGVTVPVLVLCGMASGNRKTPAPELFAVDIVLDVGQIAHLSPRLGRNVTCIRIPGAIHDVFLSQPATRHRAFDELSNWLTA
jgi:pimeloyl-ACP methyl ester carboxylesterase